MILNSGMYIKSRQRRKKKFSLMLIAVLFVLSTIGYILCQYIFRSKDSYDFSQRFSKIYTENSDICVYRSFAYYLATYDGGDSAEKDSISSEAVLLCDIDNKEVKFSKSAFNKMHPASTTKIMTAYLTLKYANLDDEIVVGEEILGLDKASSMAGLKEGDKLSVEQLLYGLMLASGNDAANVLAKHTAGDIESFVTLMNKEAKALAAVDTNFTNPHGLTDDEHYTSAYDLYLIMNAAMQYDKFKEISSRAAYQANYTDAEGNIKTKNWVNSNKFLDPADNIILSEGFKTVASKTGTTLAAGNCLVLAARRDNEPTYISVVLKAGDKNLLYKESFC